MIKPKLEILELGQNLVKGETPSGAKGIANITEYQVKGECNILFEVILQLQEWDNGEKNINCIEASGSSVFSTIPGRMRLSIYDLPEIGKSWVLIKTAELKHYKPPHANLVKKGAEFYREKLQISLDEFLNQFGQCRIASKEELLNEFGKSGTDLCVLFESENLSIPLAAYVLTRIFPLTTWQIINK